MQLMSLLLIAHRARITDPTWVFFVVLCIILFAPLLLRRLRIPHVVGLILAGMLVGQYGLNLLERDSSFELFGQVGIYYIMFLAGLELDMGSVSKYGRSGLRFGLLSFGIPFVLGLFTSYYVLGFDALTCILLACIYSSHTLVSYPIVRRYGISHHQTVVISVVATVIGIFASLLVLAFLIGAMAPNTTLLTWVYFVLRCIAYTAFVLYAYPRMGRWFLRRFDDNVIQYIFVLGLVFLSAALAKLVGLEGLLGAFLAGLVINRLVPKTGPLMNRLEFVGNALFIPYFLIGVGMIIDLRIMLSGWATLSIVIVMVLTGALSKFVAAAVMAWSSGENRNAMWLMFGLTNAHAAGALAIVMIGSHPEVNLMTPDVLNGTVMLILFSCIISSFATSKGARQLALSDTSLEKNQGSYHGKCLITYSQEETVDMMTQLAILLRNPRIPDSLMGLAVAYDAENNDGVDRYRRGKLLLEQAQSIAAAADVPMAILNRMSTNIAGGILHTMKEYDCGEVVVSLTDRTTGMPKSSLGTIIDNVISGSYREIMAVRSIVPLGTLRRIMVVVPQKAEYEVGFYKWLEHLCRIGGQLGCHLEFHAHVETLPYIRGYMEQKHDQIRTEYHEMNQWDRFLQLQEETGLSSMLVIVTARTGFISYQPSFDNIPLQIHRNFGHTSVMLLYPDQWGDPMDSVSLFSGTAVPREPRTLSSWIRRTFFVRSRAQVFIPLLLMGLSAVAQTSPRAKMSALVRHLTLEEHTRLPKTRSSAATSDSRMCVLIQTSDATELHRHGVRRLAGWGDIHAASVPVSQLSALAANPRVQRIEAGPSAVAHMDTSAIITRAAALQAPSDGSLPYTGKGVVVGVMDIGFDLTHPTFYTRDMSEYRIRSFWDQLDYTGLGDDTAVLPVGTSYTRQESILRKAHSADGYLQFHGTHTASTAVGSGYDSPYVGIAPEADICLVSNAVTSDRALIPDSLLQFYTTATDLLGFQYIFDYATRVGKPCVINFSEGSMQDLYGDNLLAFAVLDSMVGPGRIICSSAGNQSLRQTYLHKPVEREVARAMLSFADRSGYYTLRSSALTTFGLTFFDGPDRVLYEHHIDMRHILEQPDSIQTDTLQVGAYTYQIFTASYPSCYDASQWATELLVRDITPGRESDAQIGLTLSGIGEEVEAVASGGYFDHYSRFPDWVDAGTSHNIHFPSCAPSVICVGSTAYRTGVRNADGKWMDFNFGKDGERGTHSSIGPSLMGLTKPDVMAPGLNIIAGFSSYYMERNPGDWHSDFHVRCFDHEGRRYAWNAQSGTSMSSPIVAGIIALWMQEIPLLTTEQVLEAIAATATHHDPALTYPNNYYGHGEIDATAGLHYLRDHCLGIREGVGSPDTARAGVYTLSGQRVSHPRRGIYIRDGRKYWVP